MRSKILVDRGPLLMIPSSSFALEGEETRKRPAVGAGCNLHSAARVKVERQGKSGRPFLLASCPVESEDDREEPKKKEGVWM